MKKLLFICAIIAVTFSAWMPQTKGDGEYKTDLKMLLYAQPGDLGITLKNNLMKHFPYIQQFDSMVSYEAFEGKLRMDGYHILCLLGCEKGGKYDIPFKLEKLIDEYVRCGVAGLVVSGDFIAPGTNNPLIENLVGARLGAEKRVGMTMARIVDVTDPCVKDVAQSFQANLGTIREAMVYPSAKKIAVTNDGTAVYWKHIQGQAKAAYISLGDNGEAISNLEISRLFVNVIDNIQGSGWLQPLEAPRNIRCTSGDGKVRIRWDAPFDPSKVVGYRIFRRQANETAKCVHDFPVLADQPREYIDENVENGQTYIYKVCSIVPPDEIFTCSNDCISSFSRATPGKPTLETITPIPGAATIIGDKYVVRGKAPPGSKVRIEYTLLPSGEKGFVEGIADENGNFTIEIPVPPGQTVEYYIIVENELGDQNRIGPFRVNASSQSVIVALTINNENAYVNGLPWPEPLKPTPYIKNSRTMVNFRFIGERLGAAVDYFPKEPGKLVEKVTYDMVSGVKGPIHIELFINKTEYIINGERKLLDAAPEIKSGRTMVPLRLISEAMGAKVDWNAKFKRVTITYPDPDPKP
jgi:hypothetical protein